MGATFPVVAVGILTTSQRYFVSSVTIQKKNDKPVLAYHGMLHLKVLKNTEKDAHNDTSGLIDDETVNLEDVKHIFGLMYVCVLGKLDLVENEEALIDDEL